MAMVVVVEMVTMVVVATVAMVVVQTVEKVAETVVHQRPTPASKILMHVSQKEKAKAIAVRLLRHQMSTERKLQRIFRLRN